MAPSSEFEKLCHEMIELHRKKNADYTQHDPFENFHKVAQLQQWFDFPTDKAFVGMIAVKLARLAALLNTGKPPNNESVDDTFRDLTVYAGLWTAYHRSRPRPEEVEHLQKALDTIEENYMKNLREGEWPVSSTTQPPVVSIKPQGEWKP